MNKELAKKIIDETAKTYNLIADSFSQTRRWTQPEIDNLIISRIKNGNKVLDIGCGNGRFCPTVINVGADYTGIDIAENLIKIAKKNYPAGKFAIAAANNLPFPDQTFDTVISIAVLHHLPSKKLRQRFLQEIRRVLKNNGDFIAVVWDLRPHYLLKAGKLKRLRYFLIEQLKIAARVSKLDFGDFYLSWQNKYQRYLHIFTLSELRNLSKTAGLKTIDSGILKSSKNQEQNLYIIAKKMEND